MPTIFAPKSVNGLGIRIASTDACGVPLGTSNTVAAFSGFISMKLSPQLETGQEIIVKKADGTICVAYKQGDQVKWLNATLELCGVPYPALSLLLGLGSLMVSTNIVGGVLPSRDAGATIAPTQIDIFSLNVSGDACVGGTNPYIQWTLPLTKNWQISGDLSFGAEALNFTVAGQAYENASFEPVVTEDYTAGQITSIQAGGALAWIGREDLPTFADDAFAVV